MMDNLSMFAIMMIASLLSTMNIWTDNWRDIRLSLNDFYMAFLMTGWMFLFMGLFNYISNTVHRPHNSAIMQILLGLSLILISMFFIRNQTFIDQQQYLRGMIPHHSMALHMSRKLLENYDAKLDPRVRALATNILKTQTEEIDLMKSISS